MGIYLVMGLSFGVNALLLMGVQRLMGHMPQLHRLLMAAAIGGLYSGLSLLRRFFFLQNAAWFALQLMGLSMIAFGLSRSALRRGLLFVLLRLAVDGITAGLNRGGLWEALGAAGLVCLLCGVALGGKVGKGRYVPVEITCGNRKVQLTALEDTGNCLRDPVTGASVLVVGAQAARLLTGLTQQQLRSPLTTLGAIPGLRLIPYRTVGTGSGLLLALRFQNVRIGSWQGSTLVAFAPEGLEMGHPYQALTGGLL